MVPASFVRMDALPVTANGKVDRAALPNPGDANRLREENFVAPSGPVQQRLAGIIASLLHVERIGANDNFFLLGGHSLLGTQLIGRVNETFGIELPLLQIFDHPTLAEMSGVIETLILAKLELASAGELHRHADKTSV
jgi:acyl carrier protein